MAQGYANAESDANIATSVWTTWVNAGHKALWRLFAKYNPDVVTEGPTSFSLSGSTDTYTVATLSPTFWKLRAIDKQFGGDWQRLRRMTFDQRNRVRDGYRLMGSKIRVFPAGACPGTYRVFWIPEPTALSNDEDQIEAAVNMYDDAIALFAAIRARKRQRKDFQDLLGDYMALVEDIKANAERDESEPDSVVDVEAGIYPEELPGPA